MFYDDLEEELKVDHSYHVGVDFAVPSPGVIRRFDFDAGSSLTWTRYATAASPVPAWTRTRSNHCPRTTLCWAWTTSCSLRTSAS